MPIVTFETLESVPEGLRESAKESDDGKVSIDLVTNSKLQEFRDNNVKLSEERDTLQKQVENFNKIVGDDQDAFTEQLTKFKETQKKNLLCNP